MNSQIVIKALLLIPIASLLSFQIYSFGWQETVVSRSDIRVDHMTGLRVYKDSPFTGIAENWYPTGELAAREQFVNGVRSGELIYYFPNGDISYRAFFQDGKRHGVARGWWQNGNLRSQTIYINGHMDGLSWQWYESGEKFKKHSYQMGELDGLQQAWRKNGKLFSNFEFKNGRRYGLHKADMCVELDNEQVVINE